ncbi:T9SS type B sorting domain-containing protein [Flavobacterium agrisoli]|uniref:T9SS type B sorting domain-containing protein n=1 Tax=Flavobacterium agrisoli TaxID=2793066 RepID=A0A934PLW4_9FLAO|nr:T9SS type B sorting domain-containing protein [Flavobacterium agrisoli]MBK0369215.1 T9SS type B sorting domain-containing protein [Flavobacterium agrisoli]
MIKKVHFFIFFLSISCLAQFSKTHYIPPLVSGNIIAGDHYLYISTPSPENVNFKIIANGGAVINGTVSRTSPYSYEIGNGENTQLFTPDNNTGIIANKGYVIESEDLIYVSVRVNAGLGIRTYNHAGGLVSKGNSALGTTFRLGAMLNPLYDQTLLNFASILATENATKVTISNLPSGTQILNRQPVTGDIVITLNKNESYVMALQNYLTDNGISNSSKMIGALVTSDKPIVVNSGSFGGSNSTEIGNQNGTSGPIGRDVGFDQIVPLEKTGKEYIFVKGVGTDELERVLLVAHTNQTEIFINENTTPITTLNAGEHIALDGSQFNNGNLYVKASQNVFAYQSIGGSDETSTQRPANQNMFFVPPLNCSTPNTVDNIPEIQSIGYTSFSGVLNIVTEKGATVSLNDNLITTTPIPIIGNDAFVRYTISNLYGNIAVNSTKQVYVSYFGTNGAATYGGYYSGFDLKPEIVTSKITLTNSACIPNVNLKINTLSSYDTFQWYKDDQLIVGATNNNYSPTVPGFYHVIGSISGCLSDQYSDKIPVCDCPINNDNDAANDNIDIDYDNDGIPNCTESYGDKAVNTSNPNNGSISSGNYTNDFSGIISTSTAPTPTPFVGNSDGSFVTQIEAGKGAFVSYETLFRHPINLKLEYVSSANTTDLLNPNSEYRINSDIDKTVTVLNPTGQLLIDTNYDGIYESGVTEFSSFEIRFRLNGNVPLPAGTGTFSFQSYQTKSFKITHKNLLDELGNNASFKLIATCIPKDSDGDGVPDQLDLDSDNDGIPDVIENQSTPIALSNQDANKNGLDDVFETTTNLLDTDLDGIPNYLDLDSDNDGIYDLEESGSNGPDSNNNGIIEGLVVGLNGLADILENNPDSGILHYVILESDSDGKLNFTELDSDNDGCNDVIEAGFTDSDSDGIVGPIPTTVNAYGLVTSRADGYTTPNINYKSANPVIITLQPQSQTVCELQTAVLTIDSNADTFQWQFSTDGGVFWTNLLDGDVYSGAQTKSLQIKANTASITYQYRVIIHKNNTICEVVSSTATLNILTLPILTSPITIIQCDDDTDGITTFNLTEKNNAISAHYTDEVFTYFTSGAGAISNDNNQKITNPIAFTTGNTSVWSRVENTNGCISIAELQLIVSTTQIPSSFQKTLENCDDFVNANENDYDGIASFDLTEISNDIFNLLPSASSNYSITFYTNETDALAETNYIANPTNYRNTIPNQQLIWVRIDSNLDNSCFGLGTYLKLQVNPKPNINTNDDSSNDELVCSNLPEFFKTLNAGIIDNSPIENYTFIWSKDGHILPNENNYTLEVNEEGVYSVVVTTAKGCDRTRNIIVTASDIALLNSVTISDLSDSNSVTANVSGQGDYQYSIDLPNGPFQDSNTFENVPPGIHELYVNDKNGCGAIHQTIAVLGIPKYFTPNNDGFNDYWNIKGIIENKSNATKIFIYDRYGKLLKQILASNQGWDGTFLGNPMPADDYWYTITLEDGRNLKGHFSLKR